MKKKILLIAIIFLALNITSFCENNEPVLSVKGNASSGGILFVSIDNSKDYQSANAVFLGNEHSFFKNKDNFFLILPIDLERPKGAYNLKVTLEGNNGKKELTKLIRVIPKYYGVQHLWLSAANISKYDNPQADKDNDNIKKALSNITSDIKWSGSFILPVNSYVSTKFGLKRFYNDDKEPEYHRGLDIAASYGTPVKAPQNGIVTFAKKNLLLHGTTIVLDHGYGVGSIYLHMSALKVKEADKVKKGQVIGKVGSSGASSGPHLHWACYVNANPVNPFLLIKMPSGFVNYLK